METHNEACHCMAVMTILQFLFNEKQKDVLPKNVCTSTVHTGNCFILLFS